jgi:RNA polymerase subunit RPABC4/transcription elongation factor Spt4
VSLTKCPHCGHTVLSVASQCPACSGALTSTFLGLEHEGELAECRSCGRPVRSRTAVCPHCGVPHPVRGRARRTWGLLLLAAALLGLLVVAQRDRFQPAPAGSAVAPERTPAPRAVVAPALVAANARPGAERAGAATLDPRAGDSAGATPNAATDPRETLPRVTADMDPAALLAAGLQRKWTMDWSNLRRGPHNASPVVRVLPPGTEVHVARNRWGWWAVVWQSDTVGYIAGALLRATRPNPAP